jgi:hypothetical protein
MFAVCDEVTVAWAWRRLISVSTQREEYSLSVRLQVMLLYVIFCRQLHCVLRGVQMHEEPTPVIYINSMC